MRLWTLTSSTFSIFTWMIPSATKSSPNLPNAFSPTFISLMIRHVVPRSLSHSKSWKSSSLGYSNRASVSRMESESRQKSSKFVFFFRLEAYILNISTHVWSLSVSRFLLIRPRSTMLSLSSTFCGSIPIPFICLSKLSLPCSSER